MRHTLVIDRGVTDPEESVVLLSEIGAALAALREHESASAHITRGHICPVVETYYSQPP